MTPSLTSTLRYYIYELCHSDGTPFYVGKGTGNRLDHHERDARLGRKSKNCDTIRAIWERGGTVAKRIVFETDDELEAYDFERKRIESLRLEIELSNVQPGIVGRIGKKVGRKKLSDTAKKRGHPVYATDKQWAEIERLAAISGLDVSPYIIQKALAVLPDAGQ